MRASTSLRLIRRTSSLSRSSERLSAGPRANSGGITGRWAKLHLPLTGSLGATRPSRWPTLDDSTYWSLSKYSPSRLNPPRAREMSSATDGFSAIMSVFPIDFHVQCSTAPVEGAVGCPGIIRGEFLAVQVGPGRRFLQSRQMHSAATGRGAELGRTARRVSVQAARGPVLEEFFEHQVVDVGLLAPEHHQHGDAQLLEGHGRLAQGQR